MGTSTARSGRNAPRSSDWRRARTRVTRLARGTGSSVAGAVGAFAYAVSGSNGDGRTGGGGRMASSVRVGQALGSFLGSTASSGLDQTLRSIGLGDLVGATPYSVLSGVADYICGSNGLLDDAIARSAAVETLAVIFDESDDTYADLRGRWENQLGPDRVVDLLSLFLSQAIHQRFLLELGEKLEASAVSASHAERMEDKVFVFIRAMVVFELGEMNPLTFDWQGSAGKELIERNLTAALGQLEAYV